MNTPFSYHVSFRVKHPTLRPEEIAAELGLTPRYSWAAGDARMTPDTSLLGGIRKESYCTFEMGEGEDGELAPCLRRAAESLGSHRTHLNEMRLSGGSLEFYVFWYPNGDTGDVFPADLLFLIADLGIDLGINVYDARNAEQEWDV